MRNLNVTYGLATRLDESIPELTRLILVSAAFAVGLLGNSALITALHIGPSVVRHITGVSMTSVCACDTLLCLILFPMSAVTIVSTMAHRETVNMCIVQWILMLFEINVNSISMLLIAWDSALSLCCGQTAFGNVVSWIVTSRCREFCLHCTIWLTALSGASFQYFHGFNYCNAREMHAPYQFMSIMIILVVVPCSISLLTYTWLFCVVSHPHPRVRRTIEYRRDYAAAKSNYICLIIFMLVVSPLVAIVLSESIDVVSDAVLNNLVWAIIFRIPVTPFMCALPNKMIRPYFVKVFYYIFCKVPLDARVSPMLSPNVVRGRTRVHLLYDFRKPFHDRRQDSYV